MSRIRICQMITELGLAGAERCVYEISKRLNKDRFDVQVVAMRGGKVAEWLTEAGIKVTVLGVRGKWDLFKLRRLVGLLRRERIDILHTHLFHADLAGRVGASLAAVPHLVHTVRTAEGRFRPWQFAFARLFCGSCDQIVCISRSVRDLHSRKAGCLRAATSSSPTALTRTPFAATRPAENASEASGVSAAMCPLWPTWDAWPGRRASRCSSRP